MTSVTVEAAMLALRDSFIVDNYSCGAPLGTLRVYGAIAQNSAARSGRPAAPAG
jgi:hypothetical protein